MHYGGFKILYNSKLLIIVVFLFAQFYKEKNVLILPSTSRYLHFCKCFKRFLSRHWGYEAVKAQSESVNTKISGWIEAYETGTMTRFKYVKLASHQIKP